MKRIIKIGILAFTFLIIIGCGNVTSEKTLEDILKTNNYLIVDVRTKEEYDSGHVVDAINIPYDEIDDNTTLDKTKTIIVYCRSGKRSGIAYNTLKELGYDTFDLGSYDSINLDKTN